jgi:hypothetical protein
MRTVVPWLALLLVGCPPPCKQVCRKVLFECGDLDSERVALAECEDSCNRQEALYEQWEDERKQELFDDHKRCLNQSSCDEIADGVCYDGFEDLFVFDPDKTLPGLPTSTDAPGTDTGAR